MNNLKVVMKDSQCGSVLVDGKEILCTAVEISMKAGMLSRCRLTFNARQLEFEAPVELSAVIEKARGSDEATSWLCRIFGHRLDPEASHFYAIDHCTRCESDVHVGRLRIERLHVAIRIAARATREWTASRLAWFSRCPECGRRWNRHDTTINHLPF